VVEHALLQETLFTITYQQIERRENIMHDKQMAGPESTAVRVALWRAMHVQVDPPPHVLEDEIGLKLADPDDHWRHRPDMDPKGTSLFRASILARARFIEIWWWNRLAAASASTSSSEPA
jgi:O-methyltransferase involved in polyketide biosynthesis